MRRTFILLLALAIPAAAADQKSLLLGVAIGLGVYTTQHGLVPVLASVGRGTKVAVRATGRGVKRAMVGPKKKEKEKKNVLQK